MQQQIASMVKNYRKANSLTQLELAELAGVGKTVVYDIEKGKKSVRLDTLLKILATLNIKIELIPPFALDEEHTQ